MARTVKEAREQNAKKVLDKISRADLVEFLDTDGRIKKALNRQIKLAKSEDEKIALAANTDLLDRYFGRPASALDLTTKGESLKPSLDLTKLPDDQLKQLITILTGVEPTIS